MTEIIDNQRSSSHLVLARKYRPQKLPDLKGQNSLIRSISGAILLNKIPHAFLLSGIRGVGKTTTARIMAKIFNCEEIDFEISEESGGKIAMACDKCQNCLSFDRQNHPDIIEIDAASRTGVDDIREIIDNISYSPLIGKFRIYIIDEIHMLSKNAFNALLKTLEEPPGHVKFIFATTEVQKLPATIISRCQYHSLKSLNLSEIQNLLREISDREKILISDEALAIIANESGGSVRDSLSILEQIASLNFVDNGKVISADEVRDCIGFSSKAMVNELFDQLMQADSEAALAKFNEIHYMGVECKQIFHEILYLIHGISKTKVSPGFLENSLLPTPDKDFIKSIAGKIEISQLTMIWQLILKGLEEIRVAPNKLMASEMLIIRLCFMSKMPPIKKLLNDFKNSETVSQSSSEMALDKKSFAAKNFLNSFQDLLDLCKSKSELILYHNLKNDLKVDKLVFNHQTKQASFSYEVVENKQLMANFHRNLAQNLEKITDYNWTIKLESLDNVKTFDEIEKSELESLKKKISETESIREFLDFFPEAKVKNVKLIN